MSAAQVRADALKAGNPEAYKYYARYTEAMLEADMDRPPAKKPKGWVSINSEEVRIKAILMSRSGMWPICMPYAVLTIGDLGLTFQQASRKGLRLGEDEGKYTFVLDEDGEPKPFTKAWIGRGLGMDERNVGKRIQQMDAKKILRIDGKRLSIDPAPYPLTEAERQKVGRLTHFLNGLPQDLRDAINGFKPSRSDLVLLAKLPEVVRLDYFQRLHDIHSDAQIRIEAIRSEEERANELVRSEMAILIEQVPQVLQGEASSSVETEQPPSETTTTNIPSDPDPESQTEEEQIAEALKPYCESVEPEVVQQMKQSCEEAGRPEPIPVEVICEAIRLKGELVRTNRNIKNPVGFLLTAVPKAITPDFLAKYRNRPNGPPGVSGGVYCPVCGTCGSTLGDGSCLNCYVAAQAATAP